MAAGGRLGVLVAEVVEEISPSAIAGIGVVDQPLELELVARVALLVVAHQPRQVVARQVGSDQVEVPGEVLLDDPLGAEQRQGQPEAGLGERADRLDVIDRRRVVGDAA